MAGSNKYASQALLARLAEDKNFETYTKPTSLDGRKSTAYRLQYTPFKDTDQGLSLSYAIGRNNLGISYNPYLTNATTAGKWLTKRAQVDPRYSGWKIHEEDLDDDPNTPDDVVIFDENGNPRIVSGYGFNDGESRRRAAVLYSQYPDKRRAAAVRRQIKANKHGRLFNNYLKEMSTHATKIVPYDNAWIQDALERHPGLNPKLYEKQTAYQALVSGVRTELKKLNYHINDPMYPEISSDTVKYLWSLVKKANPFDIEKQMSDVKNKIKDAGTT
jgi:hypothetical protein